MNRFSFRAPTTKAGRETRKAPVVATGRATSRPSLRLFQRRTSNTPSLDELASPDRFDASSSPVSGGEDDGYEDQDLAEGADDRRVDDGDASDDERARLRRARARALRVRSNGSVALSDLSPTHQEKWDGGDTYEYTDEMADDSDHSPSDHDSQLRLSTDVGELQHQVRALLFAQIQAEDAWRLETARLKEQLTAAEARAAQASVVNTKTAKVPAMTAPSTPTPRERELLRLLIRIVGKEQIRALLAEPSATAAANAPAQLRRRLVTRAKAAAAPTAKTSRQRGQSAEAPAGNKGSQMPKVSDIGMMGSSTTAASLLSGTRRHEMSSAM